MKTTSDSSFLLPRKQIVFLGIGLLPFLAALGQPLIGRTWPSVEVIKQRPGLTFATHMYHHGERPIELASELQTVFPFRNDGSEPIQIGTIERSCGCMSPVPTSTHLQPGEVGAIRVPLVTANQKPGFNEYMLTVHYTDPKPRIAMLTIKAVFPEKMVTIQPRAMSFTQRSDKPIRHHVTISDFRSLPLSVTHVESTASFVTGEIAEILPGDTGRKTRLGLTVGGNVPAGNHHVLMNAFSDDEEFSVMQVLLNVRGPDRTDDVTVQPASLSVASRRTSTQSAARTTLTVPASWKFSHADAFPAELVVQFEERQGSQPGILFVDVRCQLEHSIAAGIKRGVITLVANEGRDVVTIPVQFFGAES